MTIQEAIKSEKPFKRPNHKDWLILEKSDYYWLSWLNDGNPKMTYFPTVEDLLANDWVIKEEWYEGDFKKKYPNGVLCLCYDHDDIPEDIGVKFHLCIVVDYDEEKKMFLGWNTIKDKNKGIVEYRFAEPFKPSEAPAIISI